MERNPRPARRPFAGRHRPRSLVRAVSKDAVRSEYEAASRAPEDYLRAKWGSEAGMLNRFDLVLDLVDWTPVRRWLDLGCGTGGLFRRAEERGLRFDELVGIDLVRSLVELARGESLVSPHRYIDADLETMPSPPGGFDLVTMVGVLQRCGSDPRDAMAAAAEQLHPDGVLVLTTKHLGWESFIDGSLVPDPCHSWFETGELLGAAWDAGLRPQRTGGFLPREGRVVTLTESHTMFMIARKAEEAFGGHRR